MGKLEDDLGPERVAKIKADMVREDKRLTIERWKIGTLFFALLANTAFIWFFVIE